MKILSIDTAATFCATALTDGHRVRHALSEDIGKGHAEKLITQIEQVMVSSGVDFADIDKIAVNVGPGSFTGIRVGVATARGLALALHKPCIGISQLEALSFEARHLHPNQPIVVVMNGYHDNFYVQRFADGFPPNHKPFAAPSCQKLQPIAACIDNDTILIGSAAQKVLPLLNHIKPIVVDTHHPQPQTFGHMAWQKQQNTRPAPLYLREADAKPQSGFAIARK